MSAYWGEIHEFDGYRLRSATEADTRLAQEWLEADADHNGKMGGPYWTEQGAGIDSYVLEEGGQPLLFFRMERAVRVHVQFGPAATAEERDRNRRALERGMRWLQMAIGTAGYVEMIFDSTAKLLRRFATGPLGFKPAPDTLTRRLVRFPPKPINAPHGKQQGAQCPEPEEPRGCADQASSKSS